MALIVYGASVSPFVRKVRVVLSEKRQPYEHEPINPFQPPADYLEISPLKKIPAFRDTSLPEPNSLCDSTIIADYLEHKYPEPALYPRDPYQRARALWFEEFADTAIVDVLGPGVFRERVLKKLMRQQPDESVVAEAMTKQLPPLLDYIEKELGTKAYIVGDAFSIADIAVSSPFVNLQHAGEEVDAKRWPQFARYLRTHLARPSFKTLIDEDRPFIERLRAA